MSKFDFVKICDVEEFFYAMVKDGHLEDDDDISIGDYITDLYDLAEEHGYVNVASSADVGYGATVLDDYFLKFADRELTEQEVFELVEYFGLLDDVEDDLENVAYEKFELDRLDNGNFIY